MKGEKKNEKNDNIGMIAAATAAPAKASAK